MVHDEVVTPANRRKQGRDDIFGDVLDPLTARADKVVVMLGIARDVCRHMPFALEAARHPIFDLLLEGAVHRGAADRRMRRADPLVQLLR